MFDSLQWRFAGVARTVLAFGLLFNLAGMATARAQDRAQPTVVIVSDPINGDRLVDPTGWTLYTWAGDAADVSNCVDRCAAEWPPYTISNDVTPPDNLPGVLSTIARPDGTWQVTYNDAPLYYYRGDAQPGDMNGDGSRDSGALWSVARSSPPRPAPASASIPTAVPAQPTAVAIPTQTAPPPTSVPVVAPPTSRPSPSAPSSVSVSIQGFSFQPGSITVAAGGTVQWTNHDSVAHTSTGPSWNSGSISPGTSVSETFGTPGQFTYHCTIHPYMTGTVTVV